MPLPFRSTVPVVRRALIYAVDPLTYSLSLLLPCTDVKIEVQERLYVAAEMAVANHKARETVAKQIMGAEKKKLNMVEARRLRTGRKERGNIVMIQSISMSIESPPQYISSSYNR